MHALTEQATKIVDALITGDKLDGPTRDRFISALDDQKVDREVEDAISTLRPILLSLSDRDWELYLDKHNLPLDGLVEYRSDPCFSIRDREDVLTPPSYGNWENYENWKSRRSTITRKFESLLGADLNSEEQKVETLGEPTHVNPSIESLPERLRKNVSSAKIELPDSHEAMRLIHLALAAIHERGRNLLSVIRCCGAVLDKLFPGDSSRSAGTYLYRQTRALIDDRLAQQPADLEALCWSAELKLLAGHVIEAEDLATEVWRITESIRPEELSNVFHFLANDSCCACSNSISYDGEGYLPGQLGAVERDWIDLTEPLAQAVLRRAFLHDNWGTSTVEDVHQLWCEMGRQGLPADIMPSECWMWLTYTRRETGFHHYCLWVQAFEAAKARGEHEIVIRAVPHLVAAALEGTTGFIGTHYNEWLKALDAAVTTPGLRQVAVHTVTGLRNAEVLFPPPARILLARMLSEFATELPPPSGDAVIEVNILSEGLLDVDHQRPKAIDALGEKIWGSFSEATQEYLLQAIGLYWSYWKDRGDRRNFGMVFVQLTNVIVHEIEVRFSKALRLQGYPYFHSLGKYKGIGSLRLLLRGMSTNINDLLADNRVKLERAGLNLTELLTFIDDSQQLLDARNSAAHGAEKIDRETASAIYGEWIHKGRLKSLFETVFR